MKGVKFLLLLCGGIVGVSSYSKLPVTTVNSGSQPVSPSNPLLENPVALQLPLWSQAHPEGARLRATDAAGIPLPSLTASLSVGSQGPLLLDHHLIEKLASFNRERIAERPVHAAGVGAFGHFVVTNDASRYTKAKFLNTKGKVTPVFVRFSTTRAKVGESETAPNGRGFAIKFYTEDGVNDFPGLQAPVFDIRDPIQFPTFRNSDTRNPVTNVRDYGVFDFFSERCETVHAFLYAMSDQAFARSLRAINGYAVNIYKCVNAEGVAVWCRWQWRSWQEMKPLNDSEVPELSGRDPYYYSRDLYNAIGREDYPKWTFGLQVMTYKQAKELSYDPFDVTKIWKLKDFPFIPIGAFVLNENPTDHFSQVEQSAFCPSNIVPGIEASPDKILLARMAMYKDAARVRLGVNFQEIAVNAPKSPVNSYSRDGMMKISSLLNGDGGPNYAPNSFNGPSVDPSAKEVKYSVSGNADRYDTGADDNFSQPRDFLFNIKGAEERARIVNRIAGVLVNVPEGVRGKYMRNCHYPISTEWGDAIVLSLQQKLVENSVKNVTSVGYSYQHY